MVSIRRGEVVVAVAVVLLLGGLAGCGTSGTGSSTSTSGAITRASFIAAADKACYSTTDVQLSVSSVDLAKTASSLQRTITARMELEKDLRALNGPTQDAATLTTFFDAYAAHLAAVQQLQAAAAAGDQPKFDQTLATATRQFNEMESVATAYGFQFCGHI